MLAKLFTLLSILSTTDSSVIYENKYNSWCDAQVITAYTPEKEEIGYIVYDAGIYSGTIHQLLLYTGHYDRQDVAHKLFYKAIKELKNSDCKKATVKLKRGSRSRNLIEALGLTDVRKENGLIYSTYDIVNNTERKRQQKAVMHEKNLSKADLFNS